MSDGLKAAIRPWLLFLILMVITKKAQVRQSDNYVTGRRLL
jgi:hypothetical protein